jgi:phage-related protein
LIQKKMTILKSIMHLKTKKYSMNEIIDKRTLSQNFERSMSSSSRQRSVSVVQMFSSQTSNAFDVLRNRSSTRTSQKSTQNTQTQTSIQSQTVSKSRERSLNNRKTIESKQNDDELWRHDSFLQFYNTMWEMKKKTRWCRF